MTATPPLVRLSGLRKSFGPHRVFDGIDLDVRKGEIVVVMGPSGSGKSTLLRTINLLELPDAGTVEVCGIAAAYGPGRAPATQATIRALRLRTAMVFQGFNLFPHRTALENVIEGMVSVRRMPRPAAIARGTALLARMGLADKANAYPARLSGGQKQRVAIARGLAMEPEVMLFDEPTSALDPGLRDEVLAVMQELARSGMTMVVVTHELQFAREVANRIVLVKNGTIHADAAPEVVLNDTREGGLRAFYA